MTKKHFHEIICPRCNSSFWINNAYNYFSSRQMCENCKNEIRTGMMGLDEQILIKIRSRASIRAIKMVKDARQCSLRAAKKQVKKVAKENDIKINTDVTPVLNFFLRIIISGILGFGIVGIGTAFYPNLQKIAAPVVCNGDFKIEVERELTTKSQGERSKGKEITITCDDEDITKKTFYVSSGMYGLIIFILLTIRKLFVR